jgi:hypothetical protein
MTQEKEKKMEDIVMQELNEPTPEQILEALPVVTYAPDVHPEDVEAFVQVDEPAELA